MTTTVDLYYTLRSPYCYLVTPQLAGLKAAHNLYFNLKPVYPLAVSDPTFFERVNPLWPPYVTKDTQRIAKRLNIPFRWPRPDPIVQDMQTRKVATEQPYIRRLTRLAQLAAEQHRGQEYVTVVSALLYNPEIDGWNTGDHLAKALQSVNLDLDAMDHKIANEQDRIDTAIAQNRADQLAAGHWGAPLFVTKGECFFGQDRLDDLIWHLNNLESSS